MIVSPLQQLPTADAPLNGMGQPLAVGSSPLRDGAFSAWLAATTAPTVTVPKNTAPKNVVTETPLPGDTVPIPNPDGVVPQEGLVASVDGTGVSVGGASAPQHTGISTNPTGAAKQDAILNSPNLFAAKVGFTPILDSSGVSTKDLLGSSVAETQVGKNGVTHATATGNTPTSANVLTSKPAELPGANLAQILLGQAVAQNSGNAKSGTPNAAPLTQSAQGFDGAAQIAEPAIQSNSTNNTNSNAPLLVANGATRENTKVANQGSQTARGSLNTTINTADIAVQMARHKADGSNQFTIRLSPESLGTVTIKLNVGNNAQLTAQMQVEKPETLALLQKDLAGLEKALKAQGFNTSSSDISIALKSATTAMRMGDVMGDNVGDQRPGQNTSQNQPAAQASQNNSTSNAQSASGQNVSNQNPQSGALDRGAAGNSLPSGDMGGFQQSSQGRGEQSQMTSDQGFQEHPDAAEADDLDAATQDILENITSAYQASNIRVGMSSQIDLSI